MATGLPAVVSDEGGIPEIVKDGETGLIVKAGDSKALCEGLSRIALEIDLRRELGEAAKVVAISGHSPSVYCQRLLDIHRQLST